MDWLARMNGAIDYIEANLEGEILLSEAARRAGCSSHQFQRVFSFTTDVTLGGYIRRRRLTLAALELQGGESAKVIDVAVKYGYESPVSFARAFFAMHGVTPDMARKAGIQLKAYPRISFLITIKGAEAMNYRIEAKEAFEVFGIEEVFRVDGGGEYSLKTPAELWSKCHANGEVKRLEERAGDVPAFAGTDLYKAHGLCSYRQTEEEHTFPYMICAFKSEASQTEGYKTVFIPAHTWAIFPSEPFEWENFDEVIETLYRRVYSEWLPTARYEQVEGMEFEIYGTRDGRQFIELWFAVRKSAD